MTSLCACDVTNVERSYFWHRKYNHEPQLGARGLKDKMLTEKHKRIFCGNVVDFFIELVTNNQTLCHFEKEGSISSFTNQISSNHQKQSKNVSFPYTCMS